MKHLNKAHSLILAYLAAAFALSSILWLFIEIPLLEYIPKLTETLMHRTGYAVIKHDDKGIPVVIYPKAGRQYNPLFIANQAKLDYTQPDKQEQLKRFLNCTDWLWQNHQLINGKAYYPYRFEFPAYKQKNPWYSALAQANILNAVYLRYEYGKDLQWLMLAKQTLAALIPDAEFRLGYYTTKGGIWFAEYPSEQPSDVLNGMMAVLIELHSFYSKTSDSLALDLFNKGYSALVEKLPEFDSFYGSKYDLTGTLASMAYHQMHIDQLQQIIAIKPNPILEKYKSRWQIYRFIPAPIQLMFNFKIRRCIAFIAFWMTLFAFMIVFRMLLRSIKYRTLNHPAV